MEALNFDLELRRGEFRLKAALSLAPGELAVLTGPSGSGKSSLLRALAGFLAPESGRIEAGGRLLFDRAAGLDLPPWKRPLGFCCQEESLFPHLDLARNLAYGGGDMKQLAPWIEVFGLEGLEGRRPAELSGGQRQRAQLLRSLALPVPLLLLDEPFGALDPDTHAAAREALRRQLRQGPRAALLVSHRPEDAAALGARELRLEEGVLRG